MAKVSVTGSALVDYLYGSVDFGSEAFARHLSRSAGDGGLRPGGLVFAEDLESFAGKSVNEVLAEIVGTSGPDARNVGGPAIVAAIHAAQIGIGDGVAVRFHGTRGDDESGEMIVREVGETPLGLDGYRVSQGPTPSTIVLSDPAHDGGAGERCFINTIGASWHFSVEQLDRSFYDADIALFAGTALVPGLHDHLDESLAQAREAGAVTVVGTVYDFRNEQLAPDSPWPLAGGRDSWSEIDIVVTDQVEALKITGANDVDEAVDTFLDAGVGAAVVTRGVDDVVAESQRAPLNLSGRMRLPVSHLIRQHHREGGGPFPRQVGDTTGCGDNFLGGLVHALAVRLDGMGSDKRDAGQESGTPGRDERVARRDEAMIDPVEILMPAVVSGGFASFYLGGTYRERERGEKARMLAPYLAAYAEQIG